MKKIFFFFCLLWAMCLNAQTIKQSLLVDFGPNDVTNGNITTSPDVNGNYWNNPTNATTTAAAVALVNKTNAATNFSLVVTANMQTNGIASGGLLSSSALLLGEFAINSATQDYFFAATSGSFKITGLNPANGYKFHMFGSRSSTETRVAKYTFTGLSSTFGTLQTSGTNLGGTGINGNNSTIYVTDYLYPDVNGEISIQLSKVSGSYVHLNVMKVEEYINMPLVDVSAISVSGQNITINGATLQMTANVKPANATIKDVSWSVDDDSIATIDAYGLLKPKTNGTVTVTAKTKQSNLTISGSAQVTISNQITSLYFSGSATENGDHISSALPMKMVTDLSGSVSTTYEIYTSLKETGTFQFYTTQNAATAVVYGEGATAGTTLIGGAAIDPVDTATLLITVDISTNTYKITPITKWSIVGNTIPLGWNGDIPLTYQGNSIWSALVDLTSATTEVPRFIFRANGSWDYSLKRILGTEKDLCISTQATKYGITLEDIGLSNGTYNITLDLRDYTYQIACASVDELKISMMGSSVANGQGATDMHGYAYMYSELLSQRSAMGKGMHWELKNVSVNGNNTTQVLARWEKDLVAQCGKYVIYGLSLGNEGIHENGQPSFDSYLINMQQLISKARAKGMIPVITNSYTRADFNETDYAFIKQMDLLIHEWDVPSINLLGSIDDGAGRWPVAMQADLYHPTTDGHVELFHAMVPSLFDALQAGKPQPVKVAGTYLSMGSSITKDQLQFSPDDAIHSFTTSFDIKTSGNGIIASFQQDQALGVLTIEAATGCLVYDSPNGGQIIGAQVVNDGLWHKITLTHFYARGETFLYTDNNVAGSLDEILMAVTFFLNDKNAPEILDFRDWLFYRAGMNGDEIIALNNNKMLKSSLELYAPLDGQAVTGAKPLINLAQSTNVVVNKVALQTSIKNTEVNLTVHVTPNPVYDSAKIQYFIPSESQVDISIFDMDGVHLVTIDNSVQQAGWNSKMWDLSKTQNLNLSNGVYLCRIQSKDVQLMAKVILSR